MPTLNNNGVKFSKINQPGLSTGKKISGSEYAVNEQGEIQHMNQNYIVNAIDIDWNNAEVTNILGPIKNTSDLIKNLADVKSELNELKNNSGGNNNNPSTSSATIGSNGNWFINGVDTGIKASEENGLTPYIKDNAWYIGDVKIFDIGGNNISLIPYEKNGTWWIGDTNTNIPVTQIVDTNYPKEKDGYWWVGDTNTFIEVDPNDEPNITKNNEGHWEIYGIDTGITAEQEQQDQTPYYYNNAWYIGDTKIFDLNTITESITPYIKDGHWWVGDKDTGVAVSETTTNVNYPKEKDGYWWVGDTNTFIEVDPDLDPNIIKSDYGTWVIYDIDTGIAAEEEHPNLVPYMYNGSWYIGDTKLFNANEIVSNLDVFIKDGHLWIGNKDTGISIGETGETIENVNYPYIKDDYWWINDNNTYIPVDPNDEPNIIKNGEGHWEIYGIDTGIPVEEEQENLVPYIYNGAWYIGDRKLFDINQVTPDLTPYVKNGTWWINDADTGIPVSESTNVNVNYPYIKDGYWWVRDTNTFIGVDPDIDPEISESEDGNWKIYDIDTGIPVEEEQPNLIPYMYKNAWYIGDTKVIDLVELNNNFVPYIKNGTWWIGNTDTGLKVESSQQNSNYPYEKDNFWWVGDVNTFIYVDPDIDPNITESKDGNWEIYGIDTGIPVKEEAVDLTPYIFKGAWYIGDKKIIDINEFSNKLTPYIKDGYWYVGNNNTGIPAIGDSTTVVIGENGNWFINGEDTGSPASSVPYIKDGHWWVGNNDTGVEAGSASANTPYIGEDGYWYINGEKTDYQFNGEDGQTPHIKNGHWWIGDYDTGIEATASINNSSINIEIGEDGNWYINGKNTGKSAVAKMPEIEIGENGNWYINGVDTGKPSSGGVKQSTIEIGSNGNWFINGVDTGIIASGQNGLTPYERDGAWYIGDQKIIDIDESQNGLTPYIKDGYWWIGETNTGVKVQGKAGNSPYVGDDGYWYINGEKTEYQVSGTPGSDGQTPKIIDGIWWIGDYNTGITAIALPGTSSIITIGENGNWHINGEDTGYYAIINNGGGDENSIPIYDTETENKLKSQNALPDKYISLGDEYNDQSNTSLIDNLFTVIADLQAEVNKLKNTFTQGIYSYNNEATYISSVVNNYGDEEEPMWAIDEGELDEIEGLTITENTYIYTDTNNIIKNCQDCRLYTYISANNLNIEFTIKNVNNDSSHTVLLSDIIQTDKKVNVLIVISRKLKTLHYPTNFVYISINDQNDYSKIARGYLNLDTQELIESEYNVEVPYYLYEINASNANASKLNIYSQDKEIGNDVQAEVPGDDEDTYRVAHIAIRSVKDTATLTKVKDKLVNNELVFNENTEKLYIKINNKLINIGASNSSDDPEIPDVPINPDDPWSGDKTMTNQEIIDALVQQGIITVHLVDSELEETNEKYAPSNIIDYTFNKVGSVTFVNEDTGKIFEFSADAYGELKGKLIEDSTTFEAQLNSEGKKLNADFVSGRGFIGNFNDLMANRADSAGDRKLDADRIRIGAVYAPLITDVTHGCSHAYVELENTSDKDYNLSGCGLHIIKFDKSKNYYIKHTLKLTGIIKAGSTYLIRGKKYIINDDDPNCFIHVNTYDQEWYVNNELIDFSIDNDSSKSTVFVVTYMNLRNTNELYLLNNDINYTNDQERSYLGDGTSSNKGTLKLCNTTKLPSYGGTYSLPAGLIDATIIGAGRYGLSISKGWPFAIKSNCIYKNTFELDPAKQAFNGFTTKDSSRLRWTSLANDAQYLILNKEYIEFPKSPYIKYVSDYTPKASFENKNVCTDKTKFNTEKPNAVTVSFGENIYTTRCFNWVSGSNNDEYVWIYDGNTLVGKFESYKVRNLTDGYYTKAEIDEHNATINGLWDSTTIKTPGSPKTYYTQEEADAYNTVHNLVEGNQGYTTTKTVKEYYTQEEADVYNSEHGYEPWDANYVTIKTPKLYYTQEEADAYNTAHNLVEGNQGYTTTETVKTDEVKPVYYTADEISAHNKNLGAWDSTTVKEKYDKEYQNYKASTTYPRRKEYPINVNNIVYCDYRPHTTLDRSRTDQTKKYLDVSYSEFTKAKRACGLFAATHDFYVSHKCVIEFNAISGSKKEYNYIVGQADKNGNPLEGHCSEIRKFTIYPDTYIPKLYQISDQQGFHWIEYQVWAAAAIKLNEKINNDIAADSNILPIILNTGDLTQSGSRINEWLDYFIAGDVLFNHFEQNNIVGNNDLNGTDVQFLGTGDDDGKSNPYYFYLFNCVDVNNFFGGDNDPHYPIVNNVYIPSLYYLDSKDVRFVMTNSEITEVNCSDWYYLKYGPDLEETNKVSNKYTVNIYTGYTLQGAIDGIEQKEYVANKTKEEGATYDTFTPIYTLLWHAFNDTNKKCMVACHEMPFTVITHKCIAENGTQIIKYRSMSDTDTLIGCHMNQISKNELGSATYWFSRLLESSGVKLCIGGHKHTYAITYPLRENYKYTIEYDKETGEYVTVDKASLTDGPMNMGPTLEHEKGNINWIWKPDSTYINKNNTTDTINGNWRLSEYPWFGAEMNNYLYTGNINWSKFPITYRGKDFIEYNSNELKQSFYPCIPRYQFDSNDTTHKYKNDSYDRYANFAVRYIMCQATGYKLKSNKELPTPRQKFSNIIPKTNPGTSSDTPSNNQLYPMFITYEFTNQSSEIHCKVKLGRITNIFNSKYKFDQSTYDTKLGISNMEIEYLIDKNQYTDDMLNKIDFILEYDGGPTVQQLKDKIKDYDNFGLWSRVEKQMIDDVIL